MNHNPELWGRPRDDVYGPYKNPKVSRSDPRTHTQSPAVTGTSVLGIKYSNGIVLATDNLASYGSLARFTNIRRIRQFNSQAILGFGGDVSDMQYLDRHLQSVITDENHSDPDPITELSANNLHTYLQKVMYKRRSDMDPLWNQIIVAGLDEQKAPYLAQVDLYGTAFSAPSLATGFGAHLAQPLLRLVAKDEEAASKLSKEQAVDAIKECLKVLFYRDARSTNEYSIAVLDKDDGLDLKQTEKLENESWQFAEVIRGYGTQVA